MGKWYERTMRGRVHYARKAPARGPLRVIVGWIARVFPSGTPISYELLECGHYQLAREDLFGKTVARRRRCDGCERGIAARPDMIMLAQGEIARGGRMPRPLGVEMRD